MDKETLAINMALFQLTDRFLMTGLQNRIIKDCWEIFTCKGLVTLVPDFIKAAYATQSVELKQLPEMYCEVAGNKRIEANISHSHRNVCLTLVTNQPNIPLLPFSPTFSLFAPSIRNLLLFCANQHQESSRSSLCDNVNTLQHSGASHLPFV